MGPMLKKNHIHKEDPPHKKDPIYKIHSIHARKTSPIHKNVSYMHHMIL